jgi:hypothetical protein
MGDYESRAQEARDIAQEAAEAGVPAGYFMLMPDTTTPPWDCERCADEGWIELDHPVQEVGPVAQPVPCPECSGRLCPECVQGKHGNCDGVAWNEALDREVDCVCERCT